MSVRNVPAEMNVRHEVQSLLSLFGLDLKDVGVQEIKITPGTLTVTYLVNGAIDQGQAFMRTESFAISAAETMHV